MQLEKKMGGLHQTCENELFIDSSAAAAQSCPNTPMTKSVGWLCGTLWHVFVPPPPQLILRPRTEEEIFWIFSALCQGKI